MVNELLLTLGNDVFNNCYNKDTWSYKSYNAITDTPSNTWCRSPGKILVRQQIFSNRIQ